MNREEFNAAKQTGELVTDAALQEEPLETVIEEVEVDGDEFDEELETEVEEIEEDDDLPALTDKEKTAFDKRLERERVKLEEKLRKEIGDESDLKYSKHREAIEAIGGDPDKIIEAAREASLKREAEDLGERNGWTEEDKQFYVEQKKQQIELKELRIQRQIDKLKSDPDYAGIASMEKEILAKIDKSNGQLSVDEAYWALGGAKKAAQIKLDATMREAEKRKKANRTVLTDTQSQQTAEKPLPSDVLKDAERMGITPEEARRLMAGDSPKNINEYRQSKAK